MIKSLTYEVTFPTGRTLSNSLDFQRGLTAICGPNESGKSFVIEMVRWCLFGSKALRGEADDYKNLQAEMVFTVRNREYRVERKTDKAKLFCEGEPIATGVRPVNMKIFTILGYGLEVFDVGHAANQGDVTKLSDMPPSERKKMVDQVIGLDRIDEVNKWAGEQATLLNREIEVLERALGEEPKAPETPFDYLPSHEIAGKMAEIRALKSEADTLRGWLSHPKAKPIEPQRPKVHPMSEIEAAIAEIGARAAERKRIQAIPTIDYDPVAVALQWTAYDLWQSRQAFEKSHPKPSLSSDTIHAMLEQHARADERARLEKQKAALAKSGTATCPDCKTEFCLAHDALEPIHQRLCEIGDVERPTITVAALHDENRRDEHWSEPQTLERWMELKDAVEVSKPTHPRTPPAGATSAGEQRALLDALPPAEPVEPWLEQRKLLQAYEAAQAVYERDIGPYEVWVAEQVVKKARLAELEPLIGVLPELEAHHQRCVAFEQADARHRAAMEVWTSKCDELHAKKLEASGWKQAKAFLAELRVRIKSYLTPSLSKVASHLLTQMTGGARTSIVVDPDFEITVDGQKLATLSGSGKACANLALRIGLGQVLTNSVLSVFIGDEIDASMDDDRAEYTQRSLKSLASSISQIILVTHKVPSADNTIVFKGRRAIHTWLGPC